MNNLEQTLENERLEHNEIYDGQKDWLLTAPLTWERYQKVMCQPPHLGGSLYGLDHQIFLNHLASVLQELPQTTMHILDYGCGNGALAIAIAARGFQVTGFDLSDKGIEIAKQAATVAGVADRTAFITANAQNLPFEDNTFDLVVGKAVLHHTIKYEGTAAELHRILKPNGRVLFFEGASTNPLILLARNFTIKEELGDVPLTTPKIKQFATAFSAVQIQGYFFLYMLKRFGYYSSNETLPDLGKNSIGKTSIFRFFLRLCLAFDQLFINNKVNRLAGRYLIELRK